MRHSAGLETVRGHNLESLACKPLAGGAELHPLVRQRRPGDVAAKLLQPLAIVCFDPEHRGGDVRISQNTIVTKELPICGSFRFHAEFALALQIINQQHIDFPLVIPRSFLMHEANQTFALAIEGPPDGAAVRLLSVVPISPASRRVRAVPP